MEVSLKATGESNLSHEIVGSLLHAANYWLVCSWQRWPKIGSFPVATNARYLAIWHTSNW